MKIKINPKYEEMRSFIERIPDVFEKEGHVIYTGRNLIKVMEAPDGTIINVKRYHVPKGPNSLVYSLGIRTPKGERAFEYPMILEKKGIGTPAPIALIEERNAIGLLGYTYLITLQCDNLHTLYEVGAMQPLVPTKSWLRRWHVLPQICTTRKFCIRILRQATYCGNRMMKASISSSWISIA